jgi:hypothetical protein
MTTLFSTCCQGGEEKRDGGFHSRSLAGGAEGLAQLTLHRLWNWLKVQQVLSHRERQTVGNEATTRVSKKY